MVVDAFTECLLVFGAWILVLVAFELTFDDRLEAVSHVTYMDWT